MATQPKSNLVRETFRKFAHRFSIAVGSSVTFMVMFLLIFVWLSTGPIFRYSDTWQLFINTLTTIITFLMVFLIQNTQNRDSQSMQLKLDEILRSIKDARNSMIDIEELSDADLERLHKEFQRFQEGGRKRRERREPNPDDQE